MKKFKEFFKKLNIIQIVLYVSTIIDYNQVLDISTWQIYPDIRGISPKTADQ